MTTDAGKGSSGKGLSKSGVTTAGKGGSKSQAIESGKGESKSGTTTADSKSGDGSSGRDRPSLARPPLLRTRPSLAQPLLLLNLERNPGNEPEMKNPKLLYTSR